jgi:hypothetical protein
MRVNSHQVDSARPDRVGEGSTQRDQTVNTRQLKWSYHTAVAAEVERWQRGEITWRDCVTLCGLSARQAGEMMLRLSLTTERQKLVDVIREVLS